ncbi:metallophosphoesterase family protein [Streptococcus sp. 19428wC2_LYSM12]|nr:metallophosphoesterase family protein [Streptococcus sp. 19428wC2_LYSM12]TFV05632.1 metallophosphoesterase [Streptococcus sp. LYSM12]
MFLMLTYQNDTFNILQFTDIHIGEAPFNQEDLQTFEQIRATLDTTSADLICITGDLIWSDGVKDPQQGLIALAEIFNQYPIPLAITYGNHDSEQSLSRQDLHTLEQELFQHLAPKSHVFFDSQHKECFTIELYQGQELSNVLYFIDSGVDALLDIESYDWVSLEQVNWYKETAQQYLEKHPHLTHDLLFLHIPLPEFEQAGEHIIDGHYWEMNPRISAPKLNTGLFSHILHQQHINAIFCGHDHDNNFEGLFLNHRFIYGNVSGYNCYGVLPRGYRSITLSPDKMKTMIHTYS